MFDAPWQCQRLRVERFFGFNSNKYKRNFSSKSNPASGTFKLANRPKLCKELNKSFAGWGESELLRHVNHGSSSSRHWPAESFPVPWQGAGGVAELFPQPLFKASCCHCENIIISWRPRARTAQQQPSSGKSTRGVSVGVFVWTVAREAMAKTVFWRWLSDNGEMETQLCVFSDAMKHLV